MAPLIENNHLLLRSTSPDEIELVISLEQNEENNRFIMPYDEQQHMNVIESDNDVHLIIEDKITHSILGFIILSGIQNTDRSLELRRIVVHSKGQGLGRQAVSLVKQYCFEVLKFERLWLDVYDDNARAIHLYTSEGFKEEVKLRIVVKQDNMYRTLLIFSIQKENRQD